MKFNLKNRWSLLGLGLAAFVVLTAALPSFDGQGGSRARVQYYAVGIRDSLQVPQTRTDTLIIGDELFVPIKATLPPCNAAAEGQILFDSSDNLLKSCSDLSGSYEWTALGGDVDQDGFVGLGPNAIDPDDNDAAVPGAYATTHDYSGDDARVYVGTTLYKIRNATNDDLNRGNVLLACIQKGHAGVISISSGTVSPQEQVVRRLSIASDAATQELGEILSDPANASGSNLYSFVFSTAVITGFCCRGWSGS